MKLKQIASNMTELHLDNGTIVLFSYETPVAARHCLECKGLSSNLAIKTNKYYSKTTTKHINKWEAKEFKEVDQSVLDELVNTK